MNEPADDEVPADRSGEADGAGAGIRPVSAPALVVLAVFAAGMLGTGARLLLDAAIPLQPGGVPVSTLAANTAGSFLLAVVVASLSQHRPEWLRAALTTGLLGSFTTFSALTVASVSLTGSDRLPGAVVLVVLSVAAGTAAAAAGITVGRALGRRRT